MIGIVVREEEPELRALFFNDPTNLSKRFDFRGDFGDFGGRNSSFKPAKFREFTDSDRCRGFFQKRSVEELLLWVEVIKFDLTVEVDMSGGLGVSVIVEGRRVDVLRTVFLKATVVISVSVGFVINKDGVF